MRLLWAVDNRLLLTGRGRSDDGTPIVARVQHVPVAAGVGREASFGPVWIVLRHSVACRLTVTPILDGVPLTDVVTSQEFPAPDGVREVSVRVALGRQALLGGLPYSRQALRGVWLTLRCEIEATGDLSAEGVLALGGIEMDVRPLGGWTRPNLGRS